MRIVFLLQKVAVESIFMGFEQFFVAHVTDAHSTFREHANKEGSITISAVHQIVYEFITELFALFISELTHITPF
jgi:hypothetical protein